MQQSNGIPPPPPPPMLPPGWTEHRAPAGQLYWFNPQTNVSTYVRPLPLLPPPPPPGHFLPPMHFLPPPSFPSAMVTQVSVPTLVMKEKEKKEKKEKPKIKTKIEGTDWIKVETNKGNLFWTNSITKESVWTIPGEIKDLVEKEEEVKAELEVNKKRKEREDEEEEVENDVIEQEVVEEVVQPVIVQQEEVVVVEEPKKKKLKKQVVTSIEEMEKDEDWQRQIAAQMAAEVEAAEKAANDEMEAELIAIPPPTQQQHQIQQQQQQPQASGSSTPGYLPQIQVSPEEATALFKIMLSEKDIAPMAPWDNELPKFINDPRYSAIKYLKDRRDLFDEFCKEKLREVRAARKAAQEAGATKVDPLTAFRNLLLTSVTSTRTHFSDFKKANLKDPRFREFGKTEGEKEKVFKVWLRELGERKRVEAKKAEERFVEMLREDKEIKTGDVWSTVKLRHVINPRYEAVNSSSLRESLFTNYLSSLASKPSQSDKATRAAASLKEREEQVRIEKERSERSANAARGAMGREEGEREFRTLLTDVVKDHEARWEVVLSGLESDSRFNSGNLTYNDKRRLFDSHLSEVYQKRLHAVESLFSTHSKSLTTPFTEILPEISNLPVVTRLIGTNFDRLESLYESWSKKRISEARKDFDDLLKENSMLEYWGRLQKKEDGDAEATKGVVDEDEDADDGALDLKTMAKQVDINAIHAVLKGDKRYLIFDHEPESRNKWIEEYILNLAAHKTTVYQK